MKLYIDRLIRLFFSLKYDLLYRMGLDGISACFCFSTLNLSPSVPYRYINKTRISSVNSCVKLMITNIEAQMGIYLKEKESYSDLQGIWA